MPGRLVGAFVVDQGDSVRTSAFRPGRQPGDGTVSAAHELALRLRVRLFHWELDSRLAGGIDPASESALEVRAAQLVSPRHRRRLAEALERIVREADTAPHPSFSAALGPARDQVAEARSSLLFLAHLLRHAQEVGPRGVAIVERLVTDGASPVYVGTFRGELALRVQTALECLVGPDMASPEAWFSLSGAGRGDLVGRP